MTNLPQVRVFSLNRKENSESKLYRLEKGWILRFVLGPSLMADNVRLFCNHPQKENVAHKRTTFYEVPWTSSTGMKSDRTDLKAEVKMVIPGSFNFFFTVDGSSEAKNSNGSGYFLVDPTLQFGVSKEHVRMDSIVCQTVITKLLGPFEEWMPRLQVSAESGYNMVHFTPVQELGISNSAYSIRDQLSLSPVYSSSNKQYTLDDLELLVKKMNDDWKVLSLSDLVYNHTSKDSPWVIKHPECTFNLTNSPHLRPAYIVDRIFENFSLEVSKDSWAQDGVPVHVHSEGHLSAISHILHHKVFPKYRIHEFYCVGVDSILKEFKKAVEANQLTDFDDKGQRLSIIQDPQFRRYKSSVDMKLALKLFNTDRPGVMSRDDRVAKCMEALTDALVQLNAAKEREIQDHVNSAISNFVANARWRFLAPEGPKIPAVIPDEPLMFCYFSIPASHEGGMEKEENMSFTDGDHVMAVNGWVMNDDPLRNFAAPGRNIYLRRELMAWGDSVKLNYGNGPADCPYLWKRMEEYTRLSAKIFHGLRLDNCHSTPIHVAEHMLDIAREVRPNLYVIAELFTGSEYLDNLFMNRLGVNSLIRESLVAWNANEEGRLVHRFGGQPVGAFIQPRVQPLVSCMAHALFYDQTHDNESAISKRSAYDSWPSAGLVAITNCATGSNRGYDQMVPHHIHVVTEERLYPSWTNKESPPKSSINNSFGITKGKRALNRLHIMLARSGFSQVFVDQVDADTVSVTRHNPQTHESVVLVARTAFSYPSNPNDRGSLRPIHVEGVVHEVLMEGCVRHSDQHKFEKDPDFINGLPDYFLELRENFPIQESNIIDAWPQKEGNSTQINFKNLIPGSLVAIKCSLMQPARAAILEIRRGLGQFGYMMRTYSGNSLFVDDVQENSNFRSIVARLDLADLNRCLFRTSQEERDDAYGFGAYGLPNSGEMVYCGLRGVIAMLAQIRPGNDLGHPLCGNLRDGDWLLEYIATRLKPHKETENLGNWFAKIFSHLKKLPRFLIPCYFDAIVTGGYMVLLEEASNLMSDFIQDGSTFIKTLSMTSLQLVGYCCQAKLPYLSPNLQPMPRQEFNNVSKQIEQAPLSMSAGFPHFGSGYMRNWGRDTFIALRGLLLLTGRHTEAINIILAFAGTLRHGLIPNLLNEGTGARYNCRDAVWYWLQSIQNYYREAPDGHSILKAPVSRLYPEDNSEAKKPGEVDQPLYDVMQEALTKHANGIKYRERNAGMQIDDQMTDKGFNIEIGIDWNTGFVYGGNEWNCGTWMDKMGSSEKAGNKGKPATPRDGSAVELVGLCASTVQWLSDAHGYGHYPYDGVEITQNGKKKKTTFAEWHQLIKANFEEHFYISDKPNDKEAAEQRKLINRRGIYKDTVNASQFWADYQLRCNFPVAMVVAPELFDPEKAWIALKSIEEHMMGPLGMKTLDASDWAYHGDYNNDDDSHNQATAKGWNYHQGPEWLWPVGYFLRAKLDFAQKLEKARPGILNQTKLYVNSILCKHFEEVVNNPWQGLPELTNSNGQYCHGSCRTQAWSGGCILEVLHKLALLETLQ